MRHLMDPKLAEEKRRFKTALKDFAAELQSYVSAEDGQWTVKGFIDLFKDVYTITADTKIVSKILEVHLFPKLLAFAEEQRLKVVLAECQNWYPDFSLVSLENATIKYAIDLKTTYRLPDVPGHVNGFTLGSHGAYFTDRSSRKNIQFPYQEYLGHFVLGTIYTRTVSEDLTGMEVYSVEELGSRPEKARLSPKKGSEVVLKHENEVTEVTFKPILRNVKDLQSILSVVRDFQFFACEKWELASDRQGSGNTANIGSITHIDDIILGNGVFKRLGEDVFDDYWKNYGKIQTVKKGKETKITNLVDFLRYRGRDPALITKRVSRRRTAPRPPDAELL
jgi:hypothetical protein